MGDEKSAERQIGRSMVEVEPKVWMMKRASLMEELAEAEAGLHSGQKGTKSALSAEDGVTGLVEGQRRFRSAEEDVKGRNEGNAEGNPPLDVEQAQAQAAEMSTASSLTEVVQA